MTDEFSLDKYVKKPEALGDPEMIMLVGPPGGGKTRLAASAAEVEGLYPVLIIDTEGSTTGTLRSLPKDRIDVLRPMEVFPAKEVYPATVQVLEGLLTQEHKYKTVIIDTADVFAEWATAYGHVDGNAFAKWEFLHSELTAPPSYTKSGKQVNRGLFHRLKTANFLAVLVVHDKQEYNDEGALVRDTFQWQGQGKTKLGGIPDLVGIITRNTTSSGVAKSTMKVGSSTRASSKNRYEQELPAKIEDPTMTSLYAAIRNKSEESN